MSEETKTVHVRHHKSIGNTHIGQTVDRAIASAIAVAIPLVTAYAVSVVITEIEEARMRRSIKNFWDEKKAAYEAKQEAK